MDEGRSRTYVDPAREAEYERRVRELILSETSGSRCEVFLFGSRARGQARRTSDFDIGIRGLTKTAFETLKRRIEDAVEDGPIPHEVDLVDFDSATEPFSSVALKDRIVWKNG